MKSTKTTFWRGGCFVIVCALALGPGLTSDAGAQNTTIHFDSPAAYTRAGGQQDYDVSSDLGSLAARDAIIMGESGAGKAIAQAMANTNNRHGFMVMAEAKSPDLANLAPYGESIVVMDFIAQDPEGRDRV
jgi:hypothetical protein